MKRPTSKWKKIIANVTTEQNTYTDLSPKKSFRWLIKATVLEWVAIAFSE